MTQLAAHQNFVKAAAEVAVVASATFVNVEPFDVILSWDDTRLLVGDTSFEDTTGRSYSGSPQLSEVKIISRPEMDKDVPKRSRIINPLDWLVQPGEIR
jgi:hypothetical protein